MKKILLIAFMCFLALIGAAVVLVVCLLEGWPLWLALAPFALILGVPCLYLAGKALLGRLARRRFAKSVLTRGGAAAKEPKASGFSLLRQQWQHGLLTLRPAYFSGSSDPVKSLPWFLALGPREAGNASVMAESGLLNLIRTQGGDTAAAQGRLAGCDWYLFRGAVFLDVKGLFAESGVSGPGGPFPAGPVAPASNPAGPAPPASGPSSAVPPSSSGQAGAGPPPAPPWASAGAPPSGGPGVPSAPSGPSGASGGAPSPSGASPPPSATAESADAEFEILLSLLETLKRPRPLEGVVVTLPASLMAPGREDELSTLAAAMRGRLDELARRTDQTVPIYLILTGLGAFGGLAEGLLRLEKAGRPTGVLLDGGPDPHNRIPALVVTRVIDELKSMFLGHLDRDPSYLAPSLAAPSELASLERPLAVFLSILGHFSPYLPSPGIRGVWFSLRTRTSGAASAGRTDPSAAPFSARPGAAGRAGPGAIGPSGAGGSSSGPPASGAAVGLSGSLSELFDRIMPGDRRLIRRLNLPGGRRQKAIFAGLAVFHAATLLLALALLQDVRYNRVVSSTVAEAREVAGSVAEAESDPGSPLARAYGQDHALTRVSEIRGLRFRRPPWPTRADRYRSDLARSFQRTFELENRRMVDALGRQTRTLTDPESPDFAMNLNQLMWLYGVFHDYLAGADWSLRSQSFPILPREFGGASRGDWTLTYQMLLFEYLGRGPGGSDPEETLALVRSHWAEALELVAEKGRLMDPDWLLKWAGTLPEVTGVSMSDFWRPYLTESESDAIFAKMAPAEAPAGPAGASSRPAARTPASPPAEDPGRPRGARPTVYDVPGAYTLVGRARVLEAARLLKAAFGSEQGGALARQIDEFMISYDQRYVERWHRFSRGFLAVAREIPAAPEAGLDTDPLLGDSADSPHARVLELLRTQLKPHLGSQGAAAWLMNIDLDSAVEAWAKFQADLSAKSGRPVDKLGDYREAVAAIKARMPELGARVDLIHRVYEAKPFLDAYNQSEADIVKLLRGQPDEAVTLASIHFGGSGYGDVSASPFTAAAQALDGYSRLMFREGDHTAEDLTTELRTATLDQLRRLLVAKVGARLDELWVAEVFNPVRFLSEEEANKALYGPGGLLLKFQTDRLAPFVDHQGALGYAPRRWGGAAFPLTDDLLRLIGVGGAAFASEPALDSYDVTVSAVATLVDAQAAEKPQRTSLTLQSADSVQTMDMFNYPATKVFTWKPASGGDCRLTIALPSVELYLSYSGPNAFPTLLSDLVKGDLVLTPADFPDHHEQLAAMGVTQIRVMIKADGALPVIRHLNLSPPPLPRSIIKAS